MKLVTKKKAKWYKKLYFMLLLWPIFLCLIKILSRKKIAKFLQYLQKTTKFYSVQKILKQAI